MPSYDFKCSNCGHVFERFKSIKSKPHEKCPKCGEDAQRMISAGAGLIFKGSGFYITDHRSEDYRKRQNEEKETLGAPQSSTKDKSTTSSKKTSKIDREA